MLQTVQFALSCLLTVYCPQPVIPPPLITGTVIGVYGTFMDLYDRGSTDREEMDHASLGYVIRGSDRRIYRLRVYEDPRAPRANFADAICGGPDGGARIAYAPEQIHYPDEQDNPITPIWTSTHSGKIRILVPCE